MSEETNLEKAQRLSSVANRRTQGSRLRVADREHSQTAYDNALAGNSKMAYYFHNRARNAHEYVGDTQLAKAHEEAINAHIDNLEPHEAATLRAHEASRKVAILHPGVGTPGDSTAATSEVLGIGYQSKSPLEDKHNRAAYIHHGRDQYGVPSNIKEANKEAAKLHEVAEAHHINHRILTKHGLPNHMPPSIAADYLDDNGETSDATSLRSYVVPHLEPYLSKSYGMLVGPVLK